MLDTVLKIIGIVVNAIGTVVKIVDILQNAKDKHQKSNRPSPKEQVTFLIKNLTVN